MKPLISVIVPIYNVEKYIRKCVDSILNQTYRNLEIILIDDGSPDRCGEICDEYAEKDSRVVVVHLKNGGVSKARNVGINIARGQYIGFVDSDDIVLPKMYETLLYNAENNNADIVQCGYCYLFEDGHIENIPIEHMKQRLSNVACAKRALITGKIHNSVATKLLKKNLLTNIMFNEALKMAEDRLFMYECCCKASKIILLEEVMYYYCQRENSTVHKFDIRNFEDDLYVTKLFMDNSAQDIEVLWYLETKVVEQCVSCICKIISNDKYKNRLSGVRKELLIYGKRALFRKESSLKTKICILGIWLMPSLFYKMYSLFVKLKKERK